MKQQLTWIKGCGFSEHYHRDEHEHPFTVIEGEVRVQLAGYTRLLTSGDSIVHKVGWPLKAWAVSEQAVIEVDHDEPRRKP